MARDPEALHSFLPGMYVRLPQDIDQKDQNFREFRIGQIRDINDIAATACIHFDHPEDKESTEIEYPLDYLDRCRILPQTKFLMLSENRLGKVLIHCDDEWQQGRFLDYYVLFEGEKETRRLSEIDIRISSIRQNPQPEQQLLRYEFQNPIWKRLRDQVIESYSQLHNATFGVEDLVGSRVMLLAHQAEVVARVLSDPVCRYILADEVGLGKTIEASIILKGLLRRDPLIQTLIVAPSSLTQQWRNEFNTKFWLDFPILHVDAVRDTEPLDGPGYIVNVEDLATSSHLWQMLSSISWGLLIVDEAHHLRKTPNIYNRIHQLSAQAERALILSATPIQRRAKEYLQLLALMSPQKYRLEDKEAFEHILKVQSKLRRKITTLAQTLNPDDFDPEEFEDEIDRVVRDLKHDQQLRELVASFSELTAAPAQSLQQAAEIIAYISENYRIENRMIRNRRAHLTIALPERKLDTSYSYIPGDIEANALEALHEYIDTYKQSFASNPLIAEYCRILMHASASSPHALLQLLELRATQLEESNDIPEPEQIDSQLVIFSSPRSEARRIENVIFTAPSLPDERSLFLDTLLWRVRTWLEQSEQELAQHVTQRSITQTPLSNRLTQVLLAIDCAINAHSKVIVFSTWLPTLNVLQTYLIKRYGNNALAKFTSEFDMNQLQEEADAFQERNACRILLCDELGGEGRNFQIASSIIHVDLPWTPAQIEQRIGRVDRLGREGTVLSIVPFAQNTPEHDLFRIWNEAFHLFTHSMSGLEITLEGVQDALLEAIMESTRNGLADIVENMIERSDTQRKNVEEERYFEELALNRQQRNEFERISEDYRDGSKLRVPLLNWAELVGLDPEYDGSSEIVTYSPRHFHSIQMKNAKLFRFPNMEEALQRSGRKYDYVIRGTFNRSIAVQRENLVFFAPSSDPWTDAIIKNAWEADRGRCCAIHRYIPELKGAWQGFEFLYSLSINPRPLYEAGYDPSHLFRALGFLQTPIYRVVIDEDEQVQSKNSLAWKAITRKTYSKGNDIHLGKRNDDRHAISQIQHFKKQYPHDEWSALVTSILSVAEKAVTEELAFMEEEAEQAKIEFANRAMGLRATRRWLQQTSGNTTFSNDDAILEYERISNALVDGIRSPLRQLESVCFWQLEGANQDERRF